MYEAYEPNQLWYIVMNSFIHGLMYSYYALKVDGSAIYPIFRLILVNEMNVPNYILIQSSFL